MQMNTDSEDRIMNLIKFNAATVNTSSLKSEDNPTVSIDRLR